MTQQAWREFVQEHGDVIGYTTNPDVTDHPAVPRGARTDDPLVDIAHALGLDVYPVYGILPEAHP
ncbi:hypothetical protein [Prauserella cavernicola]|uniref:Uncharacterized protein n=1 Tax=Prauserella cavernicola TaxID=2800127 RepID=A0A934QY01_9PSEU|nr:hypothetical protein [Prauserella cavernicola]MBK1788805.1 hypothetical protein [Prauserella cavernicola]